MKTDKLREFVSLRNKLEKERTELQTRLRQIEAALGTGGAEPATSRAPAAPWGSKAKATRVRRGRKPSKLQAPVTSAKEATPIVRPRRSRKRRVSAETRAKLSAAIAARWAQRKATGKKAL